jgi:competence protein ComEA
MNKPPVIIQEVTNQTTQASEETAPPESTSTVLTSTGKININTASAALLDTLPGVGPVLAQRIVDYRESVAPFRQISDLTNVEGIGNATLLKIEDLITVED